MKLDDKSATTFYSVPLDGAAPAPEMLAMVWLAGGSKEVAAKVRFTGTVPERWTTLSGHVVAVAKDGSSFTLEIRPTERDKEPKRVEVKMPAKAKVVYHGVGPGEANPAKGMIAQVRLLDGSTDAAAYVSFGKLGGRGR